MIFRLVGFCLSWLIAGNFAFAEANFSVTSTTLAIVETGHTELTGQLSLRITNGTSSATPLVIRYTGFPITNSLSTGITIIGTGGLVGVTGGLDPANNSLIVNVPAGGGVADTLTIDGVRVSAVGSTSKTLVATLSSPGPGGNTITPGQGTHTVVFDVLPGLVSPPESERVVSFEEGFVTVPTANFMVREGFINALTGATGVFGQTVPSQIAVIPYPEIPKGAILTFPSQVLANNTNGLLRTVSGNNETLTRSSAQQFVVYKFLPDTTIDDGNPTSNVAIETFKIPINLVVDTTATTGKIYFWATLWPEGEAIPSVAFPSTDIPRYKKFVVPPDADQDGIPDDQDPDADNDGLSNDEEALLGTNPLKPDTDGDGLTDFEEVRGTRGYFTNPLKPDTDDGGLSDLDEILLGTDPTVAFINIYFPFSVSGPGRYTGIAISNPLALPFTVRFTAYSPSGAVISGPGITNPADVLLPARGQIARLATEIFGGGFSSASFGSIIANASSDLIVGFFVAGDTAGTQLDGADADFATRSSFVIPVVAREKPDSFTQIQVFNPNNASANVTLTLWDVDGTMITSRAFLVSPKGTLTGTANTLFNLNVAALRAGYVVGTSDLGVVVFELFGDAAIFNGLRAQDTATVRTQVLFPHFAIGGGFITEIKLVNLDPANGAAVRITLLDDNGVPLPVPNNRLTVTIGKRAQFRESLETLFGTDPTRFSVGYVKLEIAADSPFAPTPPVAGCVIFGSRDGAFSAALPLDLPETTDVMFSQVAEDQDFYTGVAILNLQSQSADILIEIYRPDGQIIGSASFSLGPGQRTARLLRQLVAAVAGQNGGYFRVKSSRRVISFALFGSTQNRFLSAIGPQKVR